MSIRIKKGDEVIVLSGTSKGKKGKVISVSPKTNKIIVEGVNMVTKHKKPRQQGEPGGIITQEAPVYVSKLMVICSKCHKPTRVGRKRLENGDMTRVCKQCKKAMD